MESSRPKIASSRYDVALSFADEDRAFVEMVSRYLKRKRLKIYYDKDETVFNWGADLNGHLDDIYRKNSEYCVMFISMHYKLKRWTNFERICAQAKTFEDHKAYILPFRFDETEIEGVKDSIIYLSRDAYNEKQLAKAIYANIRKRKSRKKFAIWWFQRFLLSKAGLFSITCLIVLISLFPFSDKFMPVSILTKMIHERNVDIYHTVCKDSTLSRSQGRGSCSHHKGVAYRKDTIVYKKSIRECEDEAKKISLVSP